jgi:glycosyltransferase involved in cell wall biosynthesis
LRVVLIGPFSLYPKGTVSVRILSLAKMLKDFGHEVIVLLPPYDNPEHSGTHLEVKGIGIRNVTIPNTQLPIKYLFVAGDLVRKALDFRPDVLHIFKPKGYSGLAAMFLVFLKFLRITKAPVVVDTDDWEGYGGFADFFLEHGLYSRVVVGFFDFQEKWLLKHADVVTAASRTLESMAINLRRNPKRGAVIYVPNGPTSLGNGEKRHIIEIKKSLGIGDKKVVLLYTRFFEYDLEEVVEILDRIVSRSKDLRLLVVGRGEFGENEKLLKLAEEKGLLNYVVNVGWVRPEMIPSYLEVGDVAIYPFKDTLLNRSKSPGKLVQLMSYGKAIVADGVGEIAEYIEHGKSGILIKPGNTAEFASWVLKLLENKDLRMTISLNAKERVRESLSWRKLSRKVETAYKLS